VQTTGVRCGNPKCGRVLDEPSNLTASEREPCPDCGSLARVFEKTLTARVRVSASIARTKIHEELQRHWRWYVIALGLAAVGAVGDTLRYQAGSEADGSHLPIDRDLRRGLGARRIETPDLVRSDMPDPHGARACRQPPREESNRDVGGCPGRHVDPGQLAGRARGSADHPDVAAVGQRRSRVDADVQFRQHLARTRIDAP
jgi:hypothetical protein